MERKIWRISVLIDERKVPVGIIPLPFSLKLLASCVVALGREVGVNVEGQNLLGNCALEECLPVGDTHARRQGLDLRLAHFDCARQAFG